MHDLQFPIKLNMGSVFVVFLWKMVPLNVVGYDTMLESLTL